MGKLTQELKGLDPYDLDLAKDRLVTLEKRTARSFASADADIPNWLAVIPIIIRMLVEVRERFFSKDGKVKVPKAINIPAWIGIIIFFVKQVKEIVRIFR